MKESCCLAKDKEWDEAAEWNFKINNWPYVQRGAASEYTSFVDCFRRLDKDSPQNLSKQLAVRGLGESIFAVLAALTFTLISL